MIASRQIPNAYQQWNARWGAPHGRPWKLGRLLGRTRAARRYRGPFIAQENNGTRRFEYPWAHGEIRRRGHGLDIVEVGGGLSGLQFVLASEGDRVVNVDPGQPGLGWAADRAAHRELCRAFGAPVRLIDRTIATAGLADASADVVLCVSVLEHLTDDQLDEVAVQIGRILRPGGALVLTVDLFLDAAPFSGATENRWGRNIDVRRFLERAGLTLTAGTPNRLLGFDEFSAERVLADLGTLLIGDYPCLAQCLVAERRAA